MYEDNQSSLTESFKQYFSIELADEKQLQAIFALRYRVYCEEFHYEAPDHFVEPLESDEYDQRSVHCLVIHREKRLPAACVRVVFTSDDRAKDPLPFEKHCAASLNEAFLQNLALDRRKICEISRLAVDGIFRRRQGETATPLGNPIEFPAWEQRTFPLISISCFLAATYLTETTDRTSVFAVMEPFLPRMLKRSGIYFQRAGSDLNYHGMRAVYYVTTKSALENMHPELRNLYAWIKYAIQNNIRLP